MNKVVHFEIPADDVERARKFYKDNFGWEIQPFPEMDYTVVRTVAVDKEMMPKESGAINGGIMKRNDKVKNPVVTISVKSIDESLNDIKNSSGSVVQDKTPVGEMGFVAYFRDTEGNVIGLWENK